MTTAPIITDVCVSDCTLFIEKTDSQTVKITVFETSEDVSKKYVFSITSPSEVTIKQEKK